MQTLIDAYVETKYVNPLVGRWFSSYLSTHENALTDRRYYLIDRVDPYVYVEPEDANITLFQGDSLQINVQSVSTDAEGRIVSNSPSVLRYVTHKMSGAEGETDCIEFTHDNLLHLHCLAPGSARMDLFYDDPKPFAHVNITAKEHNYAKSIVITINQNNKLIVGECYPINIQTVPYNAEDREEIALALDRSDVAELQGNKIFIKKVGGFTITAKGQEAQASRNYNVPRAVTKIEVHHWPKNDKIAMGSQFTVQGDVFPSNATDKRIKCEIYGDTGALFVQGEKNSNDITFRAISSGSVTVRFYSVSDPDVFCEKTIVVYDNSTQPWLAVKAGFWLMAIAAMFMLFRTSLVWVFMALSLLAFGIACFRRETLAKIMIVLAIAASCVLGYLRINVFYDKDLLLSMEKMPENVLEELCDQSYNTVSNDSYAYSDSLLSFDQSEYYPTHVQYLGYYFGYENNLIVDNNHLYLVYRVETTNPNDFSTITLFIRASYEKLKLTGIGTVEYTFSKHFVETYTDYDALYRDTKYIDESTVSDWEIYRELGLDQYVYSASQISSDTLYDIAGILIEQLEAQKGQPGIGVSYSDIVFHDGVLIVGKTPYANVYAKIQNRLYLYLSQDEYRNNELFRTYYYTYCFDNIKVDEDGNAIIELDPKMEHTVVLDLNKELQNLEKALSSTYVMIHIP